MSTITCSGGTERNQLACMQLAIKPWWANTRGCLARHSAVINGSGEGLYLAAGTRILAPIADIAITIAAISTSISPENSCSLAFPWSHLDDYCGITIITRAALQFVCTSGQSWKSQAFNCLPRLITFLFTGQSW